MIRMISIVAVIIGSLYVSPAATAQTTPAPPSEQPPALKTIGVTTSAKSQIVPSLIVLNSHSAILQGDKLTLTGVSPNAIVFADRPVRAAGHALTVHLLEEWDGGRRQLWQGSTECDCVGDQQRRIDESRCGCRAEVAKARRRQANVRRSGSRRKLERRGWPCRNIRRHHRASFHTTLLCRRRPAHCPRARVRRRWSLRRGGSRTAAAAAAYHPYYPYGNRYYHPACGYSRCRPVTEAYGIG